MYKDFILLNKKILITMGVTGGIPRIWICHSFLDGGFIHPFTPPVGGQYPNEAKDIQ